MQRNNAQREFSAEVRKQERQAAHNACRICGIPRDLAQLQSAHIYTHSQHPKWERAGSNSKKWQNDKYVSSWANCLLLCKDCHGKIDSVQGLQICTVQYLESLKANSQKCTALIKSKTGIRRCRNSNTGPKSNAYRCHLHLEGGLESQLTPRVWGKSTQNQQKKPVRKPAEKNKCIIM